MLMLDNTVGEIDFTSCFASKVFSSFFLFFFLILIYF